MSVNFELVPAGKKQLAIATLNAEKSLNSLTLQMIEELHAKLNEWKTNDAVVGVLIKGQGRAFCAGGDIRALYESMKDRGNYVQNFFEKEYSLDASLYSYPKPIIVWAHGITMGGGMGVMQGAKYRVVTESTRMAMPEITIGLFPDVGGSYFLKKVPNNWGLFMGLSGARIKGAEALQLNLADLYFKDEDLSKLIEASSNFDCTCPTTFAKAFDAWAQKNKQTANGGDVFDHKGFADALVQNKNAKELMSWAKSVQPKDDWEKAILKNITSACPTSLGLIYALWEKAKNWGVKESFYYEWFVASHCGAKGDFLEGVRALLIDKDNQPKWNPATVEALTNDHIESHFVSPRADGKNPLEYLLKN